MNDWSVLPDPAPRPITSSRVTLISREPWWFHPPLQGQDDMTCQWGYLELYSDGSTRMDPQRPSDEEIMHRKGCRLPESLREPTR